MSALYIGLSRAAENGRVIDTLPSEKWTWEGMRT